jgi:hypothetical protein
VQQRKPVYGREGENARKNFFVVTAYGLSPGAQPVPDLPSTGPCREEDGRPCRIKPHHLRNRKTGPRFPLTVVRCGTHRRAFTLYPPGHVPYGRRAIVALAPDGSPLSHAPDPPAQRRLSAFAHTYFDATLDAAEGRAWPRAFEGGQDRSWGVQGRHLDRSTRWLGVAPACTPSRTETLATALGVDTLLLTQQKRDIAGHPGYRSRGRAVRSVLEAIARRPVGTCDRLLAAGFTAGLWGPPFRWDRPPGVLRSLAFRPRSGLPRARGP